MVRECGRGGVGTLSRRGCGKGKSERLAGIGGSEWTYGASGAVAGSGWYYASVMLWRRLESVFSMCAQILAINPP